MRKIDVIINWVTQIIIFLLLASLVDMLIPSTSLKKYVQLVTGLLLILIFLKPIFYIFNVDLEHALTSTFSNAVQVEITDDSLENLINKQKSEIEITQDAYILKEMTLQLTSIAKDPLLEKHDVVIADIDYIFNKLSEGITYENLGEVIVYIEQASEKEREGIVDQIDEVNIDTKKPRNDKEQDMEQIAALLSEIWELKDKEIRVKWGGGTT